MHADGFGCRITFVRCESHLFHHDSCIRFQTHNGPDVKVSTAAAAAAVVETTIEKITS